MRDLASSSLPQRFGWVRSPQDADKALSILATAAREGEGILPPDILRQETEALALSACREALGSPSASVRLIRFNDRELRPGSGKRCSGFHLLEAERLAAGKGDSSLLTVVYVPTHIAQEEIPLPLMHTGREDVGRRAGAEINDWARERFGKTAIELLGTRMQPPRIHNPPSISHAAVPSSSSGGEILGAALDVASAAADGWIIGEAIGGIGELLGALLDGW